MNWKDISVSLDNTHYFYKGCPVFDKKFLDALKFHPPGLAAVKDLSGAYHIDCNGNAAYSDRYSRTFGFYCGLAAVVQEDRWFHINEKGQRVYPHFYQWAGNYQEDICTVRNDCKYYHINLHGAKIYASRYDYCGDFKDGIACVKISENCFMHIDSKGDFINGKSFWDLGVFHKNFATAKDINGWHHIDKNGNELYSDRFLMVEPFYNGFALVTRFDNKKIIIDEKGTKTYTI